MASKLRDRVPSLWGNLQLILRLCTLGTAIAALCFLVELATTYKNANRGKGKTFGGAIFTSTFAIVTNLIESVTLLDHKHRIKRVPLAIIGLADLIIFCVGIYSIIEVLVLSDWGLGNAPVGYLRPWSELQNVAGILVSVIMAEALIALILGCSSLSCCRCKERKRGKHASSLEQQRSVDLVEYKPDQQ